MAQETNKKVIVIDPDKCTGCHSCEMACSIKHFDVCGSGYSRIRIHEFRDVNTFIPIMCQACEDAICIKVCPVNARVRQENGAVVTDEERCIGCKACINSCPFGAVMINPVTEKTMSCDLCMEDELGPWCVKACTMQKALQFVNVQDSVKARGRNWTKLIKDEFSPSLKEDEDSDENYGYGFDLTNK